jgi:methionyl-tRNA formyltransferase
MKFALMLVGYKGLKFLEGVIDLPSFVVTYDNNEGSNHLYGEIEKVCSFKKIPLFKQKNLKNLEKEVEKVNKIFLIGWQYLLKRYHEKLIIFHDSYLPERRGFSPTVCALQDNSDYLGTTAFRPYFDTMELDYGDVYCRLKKNIEYPITLQKSFDIVVALYLQMFSAIIDEDLIPEKIDYTNSTFSFWRDSDDMMISWNKSSEEIVGKINSLGYPYSGAISRFNNKQVYILEAENVEDMDFNNRADHVGKIWKIIDNKPLVVCGSGILRVLKCVNEERKTFQFKNIRRRFK